jgi:hypothetical protein
VELSITAVLIHIPTNSARVPFPAPPPPRILRITLIFSFFDNSHSNRCEVILHCGFGLHLSDNWWCWAFSSDTDWLFYVFFGKLSKFLVLVLFETKSHCVASNFPSSYLHLRRAGIPGMCHRIQFLAYFSLRFCVILLWDFGVSCMFGVPAY